MSDSEQLFGTDALPNSVTPELLLSQRCTVSPDNAAQYYVYFGTKPVCGIFHSVSFISLQCLTEFECELSVKSFI